MTRAVILFWAMALLAGCADANAAFAQQLRAAENETFEGRVDAKLRGEKVDASVSAGGMDGFERGSGEGTIPAQRGNLGVAFYVYAGSGLLLLCYLIYLLFHRSREPATPTVRIRY
jgi:hypothetical protein